MDWIPKPPAVSKEQADLYVKRHFQQSVERLHGARPHNRLTPRGAWANAYRKAMKDK